MDNVQQNPVNFLALIFIFPLVIMHLHLHFKVVPLETGDPPQGIKEESSTLTLFEIAVRSLGHTQQHVLQKW